MRGDLVYLRRELLRAAGVGDGTSWKRVCVIMTLTLLLESRLCSNLSTFSLAFRYMLESVAVVGQEVRVGLRLPEDISYTNMAPVYMLMQSERRDLPASP